MARISSRLDRRGFVAKALVMLMVIQMLALTLPDPVSAFDPEAEFCPDRTGLDIDFRDSEWDATNVDNLKLKDVYRWGLDSWRWYGKKYDGSVPISNSGENFTFDFIRGWEHPVLWATGFDTITLCSQNPLRALFSAASPAYWESNGIYTSMNKFADRQNARWDSLQGLSAHELGHALGLGHSGAWDSADGQMPTMATCTGDRPDQHGGYRQDLAQDDFSAVAHLTEDLSGWTAITANNSFEDGTKFWRTAGGNNWNMWTDSYGALSGAKRGVIPPGQYAYSYSFITAMQGNAISTGSGLPIGQGNQDIEGDRLRARANLRDRGTGNRWGTVGVEVSYQKRWYANNTRQSCNFYNDDKNAGRTENHYHWSSATYCYPAKNYWKGCVSDVRNVGNYHPTTEVYSNLDAAVVIMWLYNGVHDDNGNPQSVAIDRARVQWDR